MELQSACLGAAIAEHTVNFTKYLILAFPAGMTAFGDIVPDFVARADVHELTSAVVAFQLDWGRYPTEAEGLSAIIHRPADIPEAKWKPYLKRLPTADPWGGAYVYRYPGMHGTFDLYSLGEDRTTKTDGADSDDINSWDRARS